MPVNLAVLRILAQSRFLKPIVAGGWKHSLTRLALAWALSGSVARFCVGQLLDRVFSESPRLPRLFTDLIWRTR